MPNSLNQKLSPGEEAPHFPRSRGQGEQSQAPQNNQAKHHRITRAWDGEVAHGGGTACKPRMPPEYSVLLSHPLWVAQCRAAPLSTVGLEARILQMAVDLPQVFIPAL